MHRQRKGLGMDLITKAWLIGLVFRQKVNTELHREQWLSGMIIYS